MKALFPRRTLKEEGKAALVGNWKTAILIMLVAAVVSGILSLISSSAMGGTSQYMSMDYYSTSMPQVSGGMVGLSLIVSLVSAIFTAAYTMASSKWYLDLVQRKDNVSLGDFFGNFNLAGKGILAYLWMTLWLVIWEFVAVIPGIILMIFAGISTGGQTETSPLTTILFVLGILLIIAGMVIMVWKSYSYGQIFNVIADNPEIGVREGMRISIDITRGYILDLFILDLSFILWILLIMVTFGLAAFYVGPYMAASQAMAYFFVRDQALDKGIVSEETFGVVRREIIK